MSQNKSEEPIFEARAPQPEELLEGFSAEDAPGAIRFLVFGDVVTISEGRECTVQYVHRPDDIANLASQVAEKLGNNDAFQASIQDENEVFELVLLIVDADGRVRAGVSTDEGPQLLVHIDALVLTAAAALGIA